MYPPEGIRAHYWMLHGFFLVEWSFYSEGFYRWHESPIFDVVLIFVLGLLQEFFEIKLFFVIVLIQVFDGLRYSKFSFGNQMQMGHWPAFNLSICSSIKINFNKEMLISIQSCFWKTLKIRDMPDSLNFIIHHFLMNFLNNLEWSSIKRT